MNTETNDVAVNRISGQVLVVIFFYRIIAFTWEKTMTITGNIGTVRRSATIALEYIKQMLLVGISQKR
jgi:hypothetical protein